jgi:hypothetical protein
MAALAAGSPAGAAAAALGWSLVNALAGSPASRVTSAVLPVPVVTTTAVPLGGVAPPASVSPAAPGRASRVGARPGSATASPVPRGP